MAFSLAQSACGSLVDGAAVARAAREVGALTLCDLTQAAGWLPVQAGDYDLTVCAAYKWLCQPRGTAYLTVRPELVEQIRPIHAGWYAGADVWASCYGPQMHLAADARRFDVSPAWLSWVGAVPALEVMTSVPTAMIRDHDVALADRLRARLGEAPAGRPVVSLADPDGRRAPGSPSAARSSPRGPAASVSRSTSGTTTTTSSWSPTRSPGCPARSDPGPGGGGVPRSAPYDGCRHPSVGRADVGGTWLHQGMATSTSTGRRHGVGLCLSGGGYRAALFHLGALRRLDRLGVLGQVRTVSAVSGGAIIANLLADPRLVWPEPTPPKPAMPSRRCPSLRRPGRLRPTTTGASARGPPGRR